MYSVDLNQISLYGSSARRPSPAESSCVGAYASKRDIRRLGDIDAEDVDELGDRFPKRLPRSIEKPRKRSDNGQS